MSFDEFWHAYPKRKPSDSKFKAQQAYEKALKAATHEEIMAGAIKTDDATLMAQEIRIQAMDRKTYQVMDAMPWVGLSELAPGFLAVPERAWTDWWHLATYCRAVRRLTDGKPWAQE